MRPSENKLQKIVLRYPLPQSAKNQCCVYLGHLLHIKELCGFQFLVEKAARFWDDFGQRTLPISGANLGRMFIAACVLPLSAVEIVVLVIVLLLLLLLLLLLVFLMQMSRCIHLHMSKPCEQLNFPPAKQQSFSVFKHFKASMLVGGINFGWLSSPWFLNRLFLTSINIFTGSHCSWCRAMPFTYEDLTFSFDKVSPNSSSANLHER